MSNVADIPLNGPSQINAYPEIAITVRALIEDYRPAEPIYCLHPNRLRREAARFLDGFPGRTLFAVKANPHPDVLVELYDAGIRHFDTASLREIELVKGLFPDASCYFMAVSKLAGAAEVAFESHGVRHFVADHDSEVDRLLGFATPDTTIHIRIKAFDPASVYELSSKFGATIDEAEMLLKKVKGAGCKVGLAFNVGSLCRSPEAYRRAIQASGQLVKNAGVNISSLDVGGGFPTPYPGLGADEVEAFFEAIRSEFKSAGFPSGCELMCEPGRALIATGQSLLTQVILVKDDLVFLNDGIYGGLKELDISDGHVRYPLSVYRLNGNLEKRERAFSISGPTCDSLDVLPETINLPVDIEVGDWIEFLSSGAYSNSMASRFNGLYADHMVRIDGINTADKHLR